MRKVVNKSSMDELSEILAANGNKIQEIEIALIHPFKDHPFKVLDDERMDDLVESVIRQGIINPVIVRPDGDGYYEMISGHRRMHAAKRARLKKIPARVVNLTDEESTIIMVDANIQREELLPSELAFAFKMKMDAMRHQGVCRHDVATLKPEDRKSAAIVGKESGLTGRSVQRYIRLTKLLPELLEMVDRKQLTFVNGVDIASFDNEVQSFLLSYIQKNGGISPVQIAALKSQPNLENLTPYTVMSIMKEALISKETSKKVILSEKKLNKFFPQEYSAAQREKIILELLAKWKEDHIKIV